MNEPLSKRRDMVDLDQFERDLQAGAPYHHDDPLAELARLVGEQHDPYGDVFAREAAAPAAAQGARREPGFDGPRPVSQRFSGNFAAIEAGLRGGADPTNAPMQAEPGFDADPAFHADYDQHAAYADPAGYDQATWADTAPPPPKSLRPFYLVAATIAVGVIGIGTAFALKGQIGTSPREVKTILADASPTKVQPPAEQSAERDAGQDAGVMGKGQTVPTAAANHEEQPVDVAQAVQDNAMRRADANSVLVPLSPGQVQTAMADPQSAMSGDAIGGAAQNFPLSDMPAPKRVRVVSVRPDGSIMPNDVPPPEAAPAPRQPANKTSDKAGPVAKPATPKTVAKTTSRVTAPKDIAQAVGDDGAMTPAAKPAQKKVKPKPQRVATADTGEREATAVAAPEPTEPAAPETAAEAPEGGFAVQLAAPGSESDARAASSRLAKKFAGPLNGRALGFHKADSNGRAVYRVRVSSLSKADAVSLCEKLKADGGSCFVAKN